MSSTNLKEELWLQGLSQRLEMRFQPQGGSMTPFVRGGDIVTICQQHGARVGDIILWRRGESFTLHRIVAKGKAGFITKGDSSGRLDAPVPVADILGRAVCRERQGKERRLDTFGARFLGLAFSFTVPLVPHLQPILARVKRLARESLQLSLA